MIFNNFMDSQFYPRDGIPPVISCEHYSLNSQEHIKAFLISVISMIRTVVEPVSYRACFELVC